MYDLSAGSAGGPPAPEAQERIDLAYGPEPIIDSRSRAKSGRDVRDPSTKGVSNFGALLPCS
ncbi:MAG: hypothetical protein QOH71_1810 [Blastocatellia bacterium]|jgi:hypothetical protein|nr:hypothetical protein [Blastocatellia bacterium]